MDSKKARYIRAFRRRHLFCLHIMAQMVHSLGSLPRSPTRTQPSKQPPAVSLLRNRPFRISPPAPIKNPAGKKAVGIFGADGSFARLASALADTHAAVETATGCFFASQPAFSNLSACTNKKSRRQKAVGIFGADGEIRTLAAVTHPTPLAGAPRHQLEYICKTVNLNTHCQVVAPIRCLTNIPKRSKKVNTKFI